MVKSNFINILQITDTHFRSKVEGTIYGVETQILFEKTLAQIKQELVSGNKKIDVLLATGDISQDGSAESYRRFHEFLKPLNAPNYFLQGNHDYNKPMQDEFGKERVAPCKVHKSELLNSPWQIILLNSSIENQVGGHFGQEQLDYLEKALMAHANSPTLLCFHHHPMLINSAWLDQQVIDDADALFKVVDKFSNIKLSIYGHVHQDRKTLRNQVPYFATPSTCAQFAPELDEFALDERAPAYRWIRLYDDGHFETEVVRLRNSQ